VAELSDNSTGKASGSLLPHTGEGIVIDIGTGDGHFVYESARQNPAKFYIGIDANPRPLEKVSEKIHRKPAKGGLPNVLFIQAAIEALPEELDEVANEVHIHFPWGSLLRAVATGDESVLQSLRRACAPGCILEVIIGLDPERDLFEIERLGLKPLSTQYVEAELKRRYRAAGFDLLENGVLSRERWPKIETSWAKRLQGSTTRQVIYLIARAIDQPD
jgi:16S rRNA (adenine(1408)-N(1))-methyltransferase